MRLDMIEEEYLENERARRAAKLSNITRRFSCKSADRSDKFFKRSVDFQPNNSNEILVSADQEWVCEKCGAEIPPAGRFCAACGQATGYSPGPHIFADMGAQLKKSFGAINDVAARYGLSPVSQIALAVAAFCIGGAIIVQFSVPSASPWFSQAELYQTYAVRTLLWLSGSIVALMAAIVFKRQSLSLR